MTTADEPGTPESLTPNHHCSSDDLLYESVGDWYQDHRGRVPIQAAQGLSDYMRKQDCTFAEAFKAMTDEGGPIMLVC